MGGCVHDGWTFALARLATDLQRSQDWHEAATEACRALCALDGMRRVVMFRVMAGDGRPGSPGLVQHCVVDRHRPGLAALGPAMQDIAAPGRWLAGAASRLRRGQVVTGRAAAEGDGARAFLDHFAIVHFLVVPVMVAGRWWGHLCFDADDGRGAWSDAQVAGARAMAVLIGQAIGQAEEMAILGEATRVAMVQAAPDGIVTIDESGRVLEFNPAAERILGFSRAEAIGASLAEMIVPEGLRAAHRAGFARYLATGRSQMLGRPLETEARRADGSLLPVELTITEVRTGRHRLFTAYLTDISERLSVLSRLERLAFFDPVTELPNLSWLEERSHWQRPGGEGAGGGRAGPQGTVVVRLRRFGLLFSSVGPEIAGEILRITGRRLKEIAGEQGDVICLGTGEFALVPRGRCDLSAQAETVLAILGAPFVIDGSRFYVDASCGIVAPDEAPGGAAADVVTQVRDAQMAARSAAPHEVVRFGCALRQAYQARLALEADLREAIHRRSEEIHLAFQPIYDLRRRGLVGFEALARWSHPRRGAIPPVEFIPLAEAAGLAGPLGEWICERAIRESARWARYAGSHAVPYVSINLAPVRIGEPSLTESVAAALEAAGADPRHVRFEITESALMANPAEAAETLRRIRALGTSIMIDDFGTGYSNFSYLRQLPIDTLKIDRAFVMDIDGQPRARDVLRALIGLAHSLGLSVVAEGVETEPVLALLAEFRCDYAQGFLLGRPMSPEAARALVAAAPQP